MSAADVARGLRELDLSGAVVCVHSSMRSFSPRLERGPADVIDAFASLDITLVAPSFTYEFACRPPRGLRPPQNASDDAYLDALPEPAPGDPQFSRDSTASSPELGALPAAVAATPGRARGDHPLMSFSALGPRAEWVVAGQRPDAVFDPLRRVAASGGWVLLMGVAVGSLTLLHAAEEDAGRNPFIRWALIDGAPTMVEFGGCGGGLKNLAPILDPLARRTTVRGSVWHALPAAEALRTASQAIRNDSRVTRCDAPGCIRCEDAIAGGPPLRVRPA
ncbi:MAG TPA: AAC(3) family N-acetyltransferase [Acidimicrobiales bacterium]